MFWEHLKEFHKRFFNYGYHFITSTGVITSKRLLSQQGIDLVMATHYFGHFLLTELLLGELEESLFGGVVVNITSDMSSYMGSLDVIQGCETMILNQKFGVFFPC